MTEDLSELRDAAKSLGLNVRNYGKEKLEQMIAEAKNKPIEIPAALEDRVSEIKSFLRPQLNEGLNAEFDDVSVTFSHHGKTICTNLSTPNHVIQRQIHAFLSPTIPVQRAS